MLNYVFLLGSLSSSFGNLNALVTLNVGQNSLTGLVVYLSIPRININVLYIQEAYHLLWIMR